MLLNLFVTVLCLWKAVAFDSGVPEALVDHGGRATGFLVARAHCSDTPALDARTFELTPGFQYSSFRTISKPDGYGVSGRGPWVADASHPGWQSQAACLSNSLLERLKLFPFHSFL